jgi:hypothetical protein
MKTKTQRQKKEEKCNPDCNCACHTGLHSWSEFGCSHDMGCKHCQPQVVVNKVVSKTDTVVNKPESMEEEIMKILDKHFPDEMDSSMLHPNLPEAVVKLSALFSGKLKEQKEELREEAKMVIMREVDFMETANVMTKIDEAFDKDENHA